MVKPGQLKRAKAKPKNTQRKTKGNWGLWECIYEAKTVPQGMAFPQVDPVSKAGLALGMVLSWLLWL